MKKLLLGLLAFAVPAAVLAHDIWLEPGQTRVPAGGWIDLSLMLGNHGNSHRDFKLASKVGAADKNLIVYGPGGFAADLSSSLVDSDPKSADGYWKARFQPHASGCYMACSSMDKVMSYAPVRDIKSAKAFFLAGEAKPSIPVEGYDRVIGSALEIVPLTDPTSLTPGKLLSVRVLFQGKPFANAKITFVPRGAVPKAGSDPRYERLTNAKGEAQLPLREPNVYLIATHKEDEAAKGPGFESIGYSATLYVIVSPKR